MKVKNILDRYLVMGMLLAAGLSSCEKYVTIDVAPGQLSAEDTYATEASATAAVLTLYSYYITTQYSLPYFTVTGALPADELQYNGTAADNLEFAQGSVTPGNATLANNFWYYPYVVIREANLAIDGISKSTTLSDAVKRQLTGEAKFFRAYYFYFLVNYFGDVPLAVNTLELDNARLARSSADKVWAQIISDLKDAESMLPSAYASSSAYPRSRVNKYAAAALLARAYLYTKDYANAETEATRVIGAADVPYSLPALNSAFINTSPEVILQFSTQFGYSTLFGSSYRSSSATAVPLYTLYPGFVNSFETGDQRATNWVDAVVSNGATFYKINKYKLATATAGNEYNVILRLAEQYLIRAEARAALNTNLAGAQDDLNAVRNRAGLAGTTAATSTELLAAIAAERKVELFGETHRWFDLRRTGTLNDVIGGVKASYRSATKGLLPIPTAQILVNPILTQNEGYN